jgi:diguanylate cyclase (GGDEF)-like protein
MTKTASASEPEDFTLYFTEEKVLADADAMLRHLAEVSRGVQGLADAYRRSYLEQRRLVRLSDRMQEELQAAKQHLADQKQDLLQLNRDLILEAEKRAQLTEELLRMATTDLLTGASTRRHLYDRATYEFAQIERRSEPLSVLLLDLDAFKQINDRLGHQAGDDVLRRFAGLCMSIIRKTDTFARYGGEEFVILLPNTPVPVALEIAERIRLSVAQREIDPSSGEPGVTVSCGLACYRPGDANLDALLARADEALYQAKRAGRNRVVVASESTPSSDVQLRVMETIRPET